MIRDPVRRWLLFLITFSVPLRDQSVVSLPGANVRVGDLFIVLGFGLVLWDLLARGRNLRVNLVDLVAFTFVVYTLLSLFWALDLAFGMARVGKLMRDLVLYAVIVHELRRDFTTGFRWLAYGAVASFTYLFGYLFFAVASGRVSLAKMAASQLATSASLAEWRDTAFGGATFGGGTINALAMWSSVALMLWFGAGGAGRDGKGRAAAFWAVSGALLAMTLVTLSRGAWLGTIVALAAWFIAMRGRLRIHRWVIVAAAVVALSGIGSVAGTPVARLLAARVNSAADPLRDASVVERLRLWAGARTLVRENPMLGVGAGGTIVGLPAVSGYNKWFVHNMYLQLSAEFGLVGLLIWSGLMAATIWRLLLARHSLAPLAATPLFRMASAAGAGVIVCLIMGLTQLDFSEMEWWVLLAMCAAIPIGISHTDDWAPRGWTPT
jgi:O-antigen ligase